MAETKNFKKSLELNHFRKERKEPEFEGTKETTNNSTRKYEEKENIDKLLNENKPKLSEYFEINDFISSGSIGIFYEGCLKKNNKQKVGIKFYLNQKRKREELINEEIVFLKRLKHKNIVSIYGCFKINDTNSCVILELAKYGDLANFQYKILKRRYLSETILCYFASQLLQSLCYIHKNKILHGDIKENNILIDADLNIKLADFSVSTSYSQYKPDEKIIYPFVGTGKYISPEIISRDKILVKDTNKIDIYSFGIVLYFLAFGCYPYDLKTVRSNDYEGILKNLKNSKLNFTSTRKISRMFEDFLRGILEVDINKRFDIETAMKHPWIKGAAIIMDEKENINCLQKFLVNLVSDNIMEFNEYIKNKENP